ncbi:MAG: DUF1987 domain-containing protein [Bacteroidales bacterium]
MNSLKIEQTNASPLINFDLESRMFLISGYSRPENVRDFYYPIVEWLDNFKTEQVAAKQAGENIPPLNFDFKFIYFNSSSAKFLYDIIILLDEMQRAGINVAINWHYDKDDDGLREAGEELSDMAQITFRFIENNP